MIDKEPVKIMTGVRRSGKTYLLKSIQEELENRGIKKENIFLISFESMKYNKIENFKIDNKDYLILYATSYPHEQLLLFLILLTATQITMVISISGKVLPTTISTCISNL